MSTVRNIPPTLETRQTHLNTLLLKMIIEDLNPVALIKSQGFHDYITALDQFYKLSTRYFFVRELLVIAYNSIVQKVISILESAQAITLTTDLRTTSANENYIAITAHYTDQSFSLKSCFLSCSKLGTRQTKEVLRQELLDIFRNGTFEIKLY